MPCMCGDTLCWSCGPAQGTPRCSSCNKLYEDGDAKRNVCLECLCPVCGEVSRLKGNTTDGRVYRTCGDAHQKERT